MADQQSSPERISPFEIRQGSNVRLRLFFSKIEIVGIVSSVFLAWAVTFFPQYFSFVTDTKVFFWLVALMGIGTVLFYEGVMRFANSNLAHYVNNILSLFLFSAIIAISGGAKSPFIFLLLFPIVTSVFDLLPQAPLLLGTIGGGLIIAVGIIQERVSPLHSAVSVIPLSVLEGGAIILFGFFVSLIVRETLHDRFEKEELKEHYSDFTEIDRMKDSLVKIIATEFEHPLEDINSALLLAREKIPEGESRDIVERGVSTLKKISQRIEQLARIENIEQADFDLKKRNLVSMTNIVVFDLQSLARQKNVRLRLEKGDEIVEAVFDEQKLAFALSSLIDNAVRYSPNGEVNVRLDHAGDVVTITIEDTGLGISEAFRPRLFSRFSRAKDVLKIEPSGLGIGLYVAKHIIHKHDGSISVQSVEGKGTKVIIVLPKP